MLSQSLNPNEIYTMVGLAALDRKRAGWIQRGLFTGDQVAGMVAALINLVPGLPEGGYKVVIELGKDNKSKQRTFRFNPQLTSQTDSVLAEYLEYTMIPQDHIGRYLVGEPNYGWWIAVPALRAGTSFFQLYRFRTFQFVNGFININKAFGVDFRVYIKGTPFKSAIDLTPIYYPIPGYDVTPIDQPKYDPTPIGAYYDWFL